MLSLCLLSLTWEGQQQGLDFAYSAVTHLS